ncbi:MAG: HAD family hydrolase [Candidatus Hodarchaeota archaeon]
MVAREEIVISFDLDYTLINNRKGIVNSFNYALRKFGLPEVNKTIIQHMIGLPLDDMFTRFTDLNTSKLSFAFREYYRTKGIYQSKLLSGVKNKLMQLKLHNFTLGVITSKKQSIAVQIAEHLKIDRFFDYILGETEIIKSKLDPNLIQILSKKYPKSKFLIIGDHPKDAMLAKFLGCPFIGVLTGFHTASQLKKARENEILTLIVKKVKKITLDMIYSLCKI